MLYAILVFLAPVMLLAEGLPVAVAKELNAYEVVILGRVPDINGSRLGGIKVVKGDLDKIPDERLVIGESVRRRMAGRRALFLFFKNGDRNSNSYLYASERGEFTLMVDRDTFHFSYEDFGLRK